MDTDIDELATRANGRPPTIPPLPPEASLDDVVEHLNLLTGALNVLIRAADTTSVELQGIRESAREHGTRIETFCQRVERAMGVTRTRDTDPAPPPMSETE